ncbi:MAG TPA: hypothetical protein VER55_10395, partial [Ardenticatenaceae bacterium]|nr:hypothetical protein [Ardenticatenaceae bacterium]
MATTISTDGLEAALREALPTDLQGHAPELARWLAEAAAATASPDQSHARSENAAPLPVFEALAGKQVQTAETVVSFGQGNEFGSVAIGDVAGRDLYKIQITYAGDAAYDVHGLPNPYLGLRSFTYEERMRYAGRARTIESAVDILTAPGAARTLLFVTGASGSGKSSLAQAGLLPALKDHYARREKQVEWAVMRPSRQPLAGLQDALAQLRLPDALLDPAALTPVTFASFMREHTPPQQINLLVVDQFEELFVQSEPVQRDRFFGLLAALPPFAELRTHLIATLRSDYLPELFERQALYEVAKQGVDLRAMTEHELAEAIQRPLRQFQQEGHVPKDKRFEEVLVARLAHDAAEDATYLPLLQVTLEQLWEGGSLKLGAYTGETGGDLTRALQQQAEQVFCYSTRDGEDGRERPPAEQQLIMEIFLDLIEVSLDADPRRDVRRRRTYVELQQGSLDRGQVIEELVKARLLSRTLEKRADGEVETGVVDIIHETLIRNWSRLQDEIKTRRQLLQRRVRFEQALREWLAQNRSAEYLLTGVRLAAAQELDKHHDVALQSPEARELLRSSVARQQAEQQRQLRRAQWFAAVLGVALALAIVAVGIAFSQRRQAVAA